MNRQGWGTGSAVVTGVDIAVGIFGEMWLSVFTGKFFVMIRARGGLVTDIEG
jgi:hypothetical protein